MEKTRWLVEFHERVSADPTAARAMKRLEKRGLRQWAEEDVLWWYAGAGDVYLERARNVLAEVARRKQSFIRSAKENQRRVRAVELLIENGHATPDLPKLDPSIYGKRMLDHWDKLNCYGVSAASLDELRQASLPRGPYRPIGFLLWLRGQAAKRGVKLGWKSLAALGNAASTRRQIEAPELEAPALIRAARRYARAWPNFLPQ